MSLAGINSPPTLEKTARPGEVACHLVDSATAVKANTLATAFLLF